MENDNLIESKLNNKNIGEGIELQALVEPKSFIVDVILNNNFFIIPLYQRKYEWDKSLIKILIKDIFKHSNNIFNDQNKSNKYYYNLGTLFLLTKTHTIYNEDDSIIIDGQQRLTTIFMILNEIKSIIGNQQIKGNDDEEIIKKINENYLFGNKNSSGHKYEKNILKIKREHEKDNKQFEEIFMNKNPTNNDSFNHFIEIKDYIKLCLKKYSKNNLLNLKKFYWSLTNGVEFITIKITYDKNKKTNKEYNKLFENLNLKSKPLNILNLIKNYIYSYFLEFDENEMKIEKEEIIERFEKFDEKSRKSKITSNALLQKYVNSFLFFKKKTKKTSNNLIETYELIKKYFDNNEKDITRESLDKFKSIMKFLDFFEFIFALKQISMNKKHNGNEKINDKKLKLMWLSDSYFDTFLLIFYKLYTIENKELSKNVYDITSNDYFLKYIDLIYKYTIIGLINGEEGGKNSMWNRLSLYKIDSFDSFYKVTKREEKIKNILSKDIETELKISDIYNKTKNINSAITFLLFLVNNKDETKKENYEDFRKLEIEHIIPQSLANNIDSYNLKNNVNLNTWVKHLKKSNEDTKYDEFYGNDEFQRYHKNKEEYKFLIKFYLNKINNLTIVRSNQNKALRNLPFTNDENLIRSLEEIKAENFKKEREKWNYQSKKEVFEYFSKQKINETLLTYDSFSSKENLIMWGNNLIKEIKKELEIKENN